MNHQKQIRLRLIDLVEQHGDSFNKCKGCPLCKEIMQLRKKLERPPAEKYKRILDKGEDMTKSDIMFLLENNVDRKTIWKATGLTQKDWESLIKNYGFTKTYRKKKGESEMALNITVDLFIQYHHVQGLSFGQIAERQGIKKQALSNWKWQHKEKIEKALESLNLPVAEKKVTSTTNNTPEKQNDKSAEYERLIASLRNDLNNLNSQLDEKDEQLRNQAETIVSQIEKTKKLHQELAELREVCEDQAAEILNMKQPAKDSEISRLLEENKALRQLLKLLM